MNRDLLLISNGFVEVPKAAISGEPEVVALGTVLSNFAHYGYAPSREALASLEGLSPADLGRFWKAIRPSLSTLTGEDRSMDRFVVYKNFPKEVLDMSEAKYWVNQSLMYWGLPNDLFTEEEEERAPMEQLKTLKVLAIADDDTEMTIYNNLVCLRARWTDPQIEQAGYLFNCVRGRLNNIDVGNFGFKENGVRLAAWAFNADMEVNVGSATDVLRLAVTISGGDPSMREKQPLAAFKRPSRRRLLMLLNEQRNLVDDFAARPGEWKRLLRALRPGDYKEFQAVSVAYDKLYRGDYETYAQKAEAGVRQGDPNVLSVLATRPGDFLRRLHKAYATFGSKAVDAFVPVMKDLSTSQLLKLDRYLVLINSRQFLLFPPKGNWGRVRVQPNTKAKIATNDLATLRKAISATIKARLDAKHPEGFNVDLSADLVKLQGNDQKLASYGRGTSFRIPDEMTFIRSASYWQHATAGHNWYDNGWNFFDDQWQSKGACCWNDSMHRGSALFSGDPTNGKELKGRACQMIDLYIDKLVEHGVRYGVWSILCFSRQSFNQAKEVLATLQWGEEPQKGKLYEPARAQMVFPVKGDNYTKFIAMIDFKTREVIYLDANLKASVSSASENAARLSEIMPAFMEYLEVQPSAFDLFAHAKEGSIPVLFSDQGVDVNGKAFVYKRENPSNNIEPVEITELLGD